MNARNIILAAFALLTILLTSVLLSDVFSALAALGSASQMLSR